MIGVSSLPRVKTMNKRKTAVDQEPRWEGDLSDDCTARWKGLMLRAEHMDKSVWWWCVYDERGQQIASSNDFRAKRCMTPKTARSAAEEAAKNYLCLKGE